MKSLDTIDTGPKVHGGRGEVENFDTHVFHFVANGMDKLDPEDRARFLQELPQRTELLRSAIKAEAVGREPGYAFTAQTAVSYDEDEIADRILGWLEEVFADEIGEVSS